LLPEIGREGSTISVSVIDDVEEGITIPINKVERVPIYPGCERLSNNEDRVVCFSSKVKRLISKKFNGSLR